jgi:hypothetical protein
LICTQKIELEVQDFVPMFFTSHENEISFRLKTRQISFREPIGSSVLDLLSPNILAEVQVEIVLAKPTSAY